MGEPSASVERELTDQELIDVWEATVSGVREGTIVTFNDKSALIEDVKRRLGQQ
jgi:hypothetical protein